MPALQPVQPAHVPPQDGGREPRQHLPRGKPHVLEPREAGALVVGAWPHLLGLRNSRPWHMHHQHVIEPTFEQSSATLIRAAASHELRIGLRRQPGGGGRQARGDPHLRAGGALSVIRTPTSAANPTGNTLSSLASKS